MFAYDSTCDEYKEVDEVEEAEEATVLSRRGSLSSLKSCKSLKSLKSLKSTRGYQRDYYIARIITKMGRLNTFNIKLPNRMLFYFKDLGTTLVNTQWRWILSCLCVVSFLSFFTFGLMWSLLANISEEGCVQNVETYAGYVLLSIETIMTIGYGLRYPSEKCHALIWLVLALQAFISVAIQGALVSAVYVKICRPYKHPEQLFSKKATISLRDGKLCLIVRIMDATGRVSVGTVARMYFVDKDFANNFMDDNHIVFETVMRQMKVEPHGFLVFPLEIEHVIDRNSPLWALTPMDFLNKRFEIWVVVEGSSTVTGQLSQKRKSYINSDVLWGCRFNPCMDYNSTKKKYSVDYYKINATTRFDTPLCSAKELEKYRQHLDD